MRRFFFQRRKKKKQQEQEGRKSPNIMNENKMSFPTAMERVAAHDRAQTSGVVSSSQLCSIVCPKVGRDLLDRLEDCRRRRNPNETEDKIESKKSATIEKEPEDETDSSSTEEEEKENGVLLHKPVKPNPLLEHSLTNSNGDRWRRQRPLVQRALGDTNVVKMVAVPAAVQAATDFFPPGNEDPSAPRVMEVRSFSLQVATTAMISSVFGIPTSPTQDQTATTSATNHENLQRALMDMFQPTLLPIRGDLTKTKALDLLVQSQVQLIYQQIQDHQEQHPCSLAANLLQYESEEEKKKTKNSSFLTRQEVIGNCHSALMAGTQSIATTLAGALLHLAEFNQCETTTTKTKAWYRAIVNETLRILPPVATLPRCPIHSDLHIPITTATTPIITSDTQNNNTTVDSTILVPEDSLMLLDLVSMAHLSSQKTKSQSDDDDDETWKFCPHIRTQQNNDNNSKPNKNPRAYPWGMGDRICPAGNLSVSCIVAILELLIQDKQCTWKLLSNSDDDDNNKTGKGSWISTVSYRPTLLYPNPLMITLYPSL